MEFNLAKSVDRKLKMLLTGPTGSGKTLSALELAFGLGERVAVIDSEYGRASDYQGFTSIGDYYTLELDNYSPLAYGRALELAVKNNFDVVIIDSLTQEWDGEGGTLDIQTKASNQPGKNSYTAWSVARPIHNKFVKQVIATPCHVICTCRSDMEYEIVKDEKGNTKEIRRIGLKPTQSKNVEYEFMVVGHMDMDHRMTIDITHGTRLVLYANKVFDSPFVGLGNELKRSLSNE